MVAAITKSQPLALSVIIPAYNEQRHLEACLDSIAAQKLPPFEVIVVDNNSTDDTQHIAAQFSFVKVVHEPKQGVLYARTKGFNTARGDIICRIDADTVLPRNWTRHIQGFYSEPSHKAAVLTGGAYFYNIRFGRFFGWCLGQIAFRMNRLLMGHYITYGSNMAMPRQVWRSVRGSVCDDTDIHEDLDLAIHLHRLGYVITYHEGHKVGVKMRRVRSARGELWGNLVWWPRTLRRHGKKTWIFGWIGAVILFIAAPLGSIMEFVARIFGLEPVEE